MRVLILKNARDIELGDHIEFEYHGVQRLGTVQHVASDYFTLEHDCPEDFEGRTYSNYKFSYLDSAISLV